MLKEIFALIYRNQIFL